MKNKHSKHTADHFENYLSKIQDVKDDKCWMCGKTPDKIREEFNEYMKNPSDDFEGLELDDIVIMTYKTKRPICAGCYFALKENAELVQEILEKPDEEIW